MAVVELVVKNGNVIFMIQNLLMKSMRRFSPVSAKPLGSIPLSTVTPTKQGTQGSEDSASRNHTSVRKCGSKN
jgi:hypothetical protein